MLVNVWFPVGHAKIMMAGGVGVGGGGGGGGCNDFRGVSGLVVMIRFWGLVEMLIVTASSIQQRERIAPRRTARREKSKTPLADGESTASSAADRDDDDAYERLQLWSLCDIVWL